MTGHAAEPMAGRDGSGSWAPARWLRFVCALAFVTLSLVLVTDAPSFAAPGITLNKSAPADALVGGSVDYTLTTSNPASNPDAVPEFNVTFRDVLPVGVTYDAGSTTPTGYGEPQVISDPDTGQQTLIWSNVADLAPGSTTNLSFSATLSAAVYPVGSDAVNNADVYTSSDPRTVPKFTATGEPIPTSFTETASDLASTRVSALHLQKTEPSPEGELLRGVHDHTTVYTLTVTNNHGAATNGATAVDLIPAGLEYLGCGGVDNSTTGPEYPGAPSLAATPAVANCPTPDSVSTVSNPPGVPPGVYTRVVWALGDLAPDRVVTIRYAAGIPQRANTTTFDGPTPPPASLGQTANLDNNNGPSTRETATEQIYTNHATVTGDYTGPVAPGTGTAVSGSDTESVSSEDVRMRKASDTGAFVEDGVQGYTLTIDTSEYADASDIVVTDHLPNGLCPLDDVTNHVAGAPADCDPSAAFAPQNATITGVVQNADGSFDVTFSPLTIDANGTAQIHYFARMRTTFTGGDNAGDPTSSGDTFTNTARLKATTNPAPGVDPPAPTGPETVGDESSATLTAGGPQLQKSILPQTTPMTCGTTGDGYVHDPTVAQSTFSEGDRVCFKIRIDFPDDVATRNPNVRDFLPPGVTYEAGSATATDANDTDFTVDESTGNPLFLLGDTRTRPTFRFVPRGATFEVVLSATVGAPAVGPAPDLTANLAKFTFATSTGTVSQRDAVDVHIAAPPPVSIVKGVASVNGGPANPLDTDNVEVRGGDVVTYRLDLHNDGSTANDNAVDVLSPEVWDVLPLGITCSDISAISDGGVCTNPGDTTQPTFSGSGTHSAIRWRLGVTPPLAPGAVRTLSYDTTIPADASVQTSYPNTAAVRSYDTATNRPGVTSQHLPRFNVDTSTDPRDWDVPQAQDDSEVHTPGASLDKSNVTDITEQNNGLHDAVVGETLTYTMNLRVPAHTAIFNGVLSDPMPTGVTYLSSTATFSATNTSPAVDPLPLGFVLNPANGTLTFPQSYVNNTDTPHLFQVQVRARVSTLAGNAQGIVRTNTSRFNSQSAPVLGVDLPVVTASSDIRVVAPQITLTKGDDDADNIVEAGQVVTYTLRVVGSNGRPPAHDLWVLDCVPNGTAFGGFVPGFPGTATAVAGTGANGCATGTTRIAWNLPNSSTTAQLLSYTATVSPLAAGNQTFTNTANASGSSLNDGKTDPLAPDNPLERVVRSAASDTVTVTSGLINKTADPKQLTVGERGTWSIQFTLNRNVNFFDAAIIDNLPLGIDPDSVRLESTSCQIVGGGTCSFDAVPLTPAPGPGGGTTIGWGVGDVLSNPSSRTVNLTYSAVVTDVPSVKRGVVLTNIAHGAWDLTDGTDPTSVTHPFQERSVDAPANVTVVEPLLTIDKTVTPSRPAPGETFDYNLDIANLAGPNTSDAFNIVVVDTIPVGVVVDPATIGQGGVLTDTGANGGGTITWTIDGPRRPDSTTSVTYSATLANSSTLTAAPLTNTARITHYESLASGGRSYVGPSDIATITPAFPHVSLAKRASPGPAFIGESKAFTLTITSDGAATAHHIGGTDTLPPNWTYDPGSAMVSVAGAPAIQVEPDVVTNGNVQVLSLPDLFDLPVGAKVVITYSATPQPGVIDDPGVGHTVPHTNTLEIQSTDLTGATGNADGPYTAPPVTATVFIDSADLSVDKSHTGNAVPGRPLAWSVLVTNHGPDTATGPFRVVDDLPAGISTATAAGTGWTCSGSLTQILCVRTNGGDTLAPNASFPAITVTTGIPAGTDEGATFSNHVSVTAHTHDPNLANNQDTDVATARRSVDLALTKTASGPFVAGQDATYLLTVQNHGPSNTLGPIVVTDAVPAGTTFVSADGPGWVCALASGQVTCTRAAGLVAGDSAPQITLVVHVDADRTASVTNTAHVAGPSPDPVPENNDATVTRTPNREADLAIAKTSPVDFVAGQQGTYQFRIHNFGPSFADAPVRITDTLPASLTFAGFTSVTPGWTCSAAGQDVTCTLAGRFADGATATVEIAVDINPDQVGEIVNSAHVSSPTTDPDPSNNTDDDNTASVVNVDLAIDKSHVGPVVAGQQVTYTLAVSNNGPSSAAGPVTVHDALPDGMSFVSAGGTDWTCTGSGQSVDCTRAAGLTANTAAPDITLVAAVAPDAGPATLINIADVTGPDTDVDPDNNTDHDPTEIDDDANISLSKTTTGDDPVSAGSTTAFTIVVHNDGPSDADAVTVSDELPAGLGLVSASGDGWTCTGVTLVQCERNTVAAGSDAPSIVVTVRVGSGVPDGTTITNTAHASTSTPGDDPADNTDDTTVDVQAAADLTLHKSHPEGEVHAGDEVTFDVAVRNDGPSDAVAPITVVDRLPVGLTYTSSTGDWSCDAAAPDASGQQVTCILNGGDSLLAGTDAPPLRVTVQTDAALEPATTLTNTATVDSPTTDPVPGNNTDTDDVGIDTSANLSIVKSHTEPARVGDPLTFTLAVTNHGPSDARQVEVTDVLPAGLAFVSAAGDRWTCAEAARVVTCDLTGPLATATDAPPISLVVTVEPGAYPGVDNTATVDSATPDTDASDDSSTDHLSVPPLVDLAIGKSHADPVSVGHQATYRLKVVNHGPTADPGPVRVTDTLPDGLTFVGATGTGWECSAAKGTVTCSDADGLQVGERSTIGLVVTVEPSAFPSVVNVASVTSDAEDSDPSNNTATDPATVLPSVELTVDKTLLSLTRSTATYRITVGNRGPNNAATPIVLVDDLPAELSYVEATGPGGPASRQPRRSPAPIPTRCAWVTRPRSCSPPQSPPVRRVRWSTRSWSPAVTPAVTLMTCRSGTSRRSCPRPHPRPRRPGPTCPTPADRHWCGWWPRWRVWSPAASCWRGLAAAGRRRTPGPCPAGTLVAVGPATLT